MTGNTVEPGEAPDPLRSYWSAAKRVEQDLRSRIATGTWGAGALLPGRRQMAAEYGIDVNTLQRAMKPLIAENLLRVEFGRGTFVGASSFPGNLQDGRNTERRPASADNASITLGILSGQSIDPDSPSKDADVWEYILVHGVESEFSIDANVHSRYFSLFSAGHAPISIQEGISSLVAAGADGLAIILPQAPLDPAAVVASVRNAGMPAVLLSFEAFSVPIPQVTYDSRYAGLQAAQHLIFQGYRKLLFFAPFGAVWVSERILGAGDALRLAGLAASGLKVSTRDESLDPVQCDHVKVAFTAAARWMQGLPAREGLDGIGVIAANDCVASGFMRAATAQGWMAGDDYGIVGFDDRSWARNLGLSSLHPPIEGMGREAARLLRRALEGQPMPVQVRLRSHLIPRKSSQRNRKSST